LFTDVLIYYLYICRNGTTILITIGYIFFANEFCVRLLWFDQFIATIFDPRFVADLFEFKETTVVLLDYPLPGSYSKNKMQLF